MYTGVKIQIESFLKGFYEVVPKKLLLGLTAGELELLICGFSEIDGKLTFSIIIIVEDLKANTVFEAGYSVTSP